MNKKVSTAVILMLCASAPAFAGSISITPETTFHPATFCTSYAEAFPESHGGTLHVFVKNEGSTPETVSEVLINGTPVDQVPGVKWWRCWPPGIGAAPGNSVSTITIQSTAPPIAEGEKLAIQVTTASGATDSQKFTANSPRLRMANVIASQDMRRLFVAIRNDGKLAYSIQGARINDETHILGVNAGISIAGGEPTILPGATDILELRLAEPCEPLSAYAIRIGSTAANVPIWTGAPVRIVRPFFPLGTWSSSLPNPENEKGRHTARELQLDACVGANDWEKLRELNARHHINSINFANKGEPKEPDADVIRANVDNTGILTWCIRDEPDLHGIPSTLMLKHNQVFWSTDPKHPTLLNLMTTRAFNEYGQIPDIACMDHYVQYAPNSIPRTGILRKARMEEALDYTWSLKLNTEPKPMWVWSQLVDKSWPSTPTPWGIDYQFWGQIMYGAKGILWFKYGPGFEDDYPEQVAAAKRITRMFSQVRSLCLYGEPIDCVRIEGADVRARGLVSMDALVVIVLNNKYSTPGFPWAPAYRPKRQQGKLTVALPSWIQPERILQISEDGSTSPNFSISEAELQMDFGISTESLVFTVGRKDNVPPAEPEGLMQIESEGKNLELSWKEPFDNFGVKGYKIYENGSEIADVRTPIFVGDRVSAQGAAYTVAAYDSEGNLGKQSARASR